MKKIDIPKEKLIELYQIQKLNMKQIAKIYNVDRTTISNKLKHFEIEINHNIRKNEYKNLISLNDNQKSLIVGTLLGDGSLIKNKNRKFPYLKVSHCEKQKDYLIWKKDILGELVNSVSCYNDKRGNSIMHSFNSLSSKEFIDTYNLFYDNNKKVIREDLINHLNEFGIAVWFMDDGSSQKSSSRFSTEGFSVEENKILQKILKNKFDIETKISYYSRNDKKYNYLLLNKNNTIKLNNIIKPFVIDCMKYKLLDCSSTTTC
ncbi:MAG: hypothetical protein LC122_13025 [Chitinophagales bacterium]|nr:hypothetical protein [Chitinophagales bacterium]